MNRQHALVIGNRVWSSRHAHQLLACVAIIGLAASLVHVGFARHQVALSQQAAQIEMQIEQSIITPTPFQLSETDAVLGESLDRQQQYALLISKVEQWDTPCFDAARRDFQQYKSSPQAFDRFVAQLWDCSE